MNDVFIYETNQKLTFQPLIPKGWNGRLLPYARPHYWAGPEGNILVQELEHPLFRLQYSVIKFVREMTLVFRKPEGLQSTISLRGDVQAQAGRLPAFTLTEGACCLLAGEDAPIVTTFAKDQECQLWNVQPAEALYQSYAPLFPEFQLQHPTLSLLSPHPLAARTRVLDLIATHFYEPFQPAVQQALFELKVRETLLSLMTQTFHDPSPSLSPREQQKAQQARDIILSDISRHLSNVEIARQVGINEADLKRIFKRQYGLAMFQLLQKARFEKASELLLQNEYTMAQIAGIVGYSHTTTFITEFRKFYGYTPLDLQKRRR